MEDEPIASVMQNMRKGSKWLSAFLESYRPPLDGERYLTDGEVSELLRVSRRTLQEYRNNRVLPFILLGGKVLTRKRCCARCWKRTTASRYDVDFVVRNKKITFAICLRLVVITCSISCALGFPMPSYFQLVLGAVSFFNTLGKGGFKYDKNYNEGGRGCSGRPKQESSYEDSKCNHILR